MAELIANTKFKKGQRVKLTERAISQGLARRWRGQVITTGIVAGFCDNPFMIQVRRTGRQRTDAWHIDFWEADRRRKRVTT